jgi:hypothetical protein
MYSNAMGLVENTPMINDYGKTILERFDAPLGYDRVQIQPNSFAEYLRTLGLKPEGSVVRYYNGQIKTNNNVYVSVVDLPISKKNLQYSTDSVIRLLSEYLFSQNKFDKIAFHSDHKKIGFVDFADGDLSRNSFNEYLDFVMEKVSTPSFCQDLKSVKLQEIKIGDVFVQNTQPNGHAVLVVDVVENKSGEKLFLLAQSFQPAQEIQIISNPNHSDISPWYQLKEGELLTPEWRFMTSDLMRFKFLED